LGRPRSRWKDNIKIVFRETGIDVTNWNRLAQDKVHWSDFVSTVMKLRIP
jgi:hypothetical protein